MTIRCVCDRVYESVGSIYPTCPACGHVWDLEGYPLEVVPERDVTYLFRNVGNAPPENKRGKAPRR